jgi:hypothetical protein
LLRKFASFQVAYIKIGVQEATARSGEATLQHPLKSERAKSAVL